MPENEHGPLSRNEITLIREVIKADLLIVDTKHTAAFTGLKELVTVQLADSRNNVRLAAEALKEYKIQVNEWPTTLRQLSESKANISDLSSVREELRRLNAEIAGLRESRSAQGERSTTQEGDHARTLIYVTIGLSFVFSLVGVLMSVITYLKK